jgi:tRNA(Ile)-lysidine synthase
VSAAWVAVEQQRAPHAELGGRAPDVWAVACSGGRDSLALTHVAARLAAERCEQGRPTEVVALHVHHGLMPEADAWVEQVSEAVASWAAAGWPVRVVVRRVAVAVLPGDSLEQRARQARHSALQDMAGEVGAHVLWLAHHRRDQAETLLLQGLRGSGVSGLAGMPALAQRRGLWWGRPWLAVDPQAIADHVSRHGLRHVEDGSNGDVRWARNRLRHEVWPALSQAFPHAEGSFAMAAAHVADTLPIVAQWLHRECEALGMLGCTWPVQAWAQRPAHERRLLLAHWYRACVGRSLPASWVQRLADEWPALAACAQPWSDSTLGLSLYRGEVAWAASPSAAVSGVGEPQGFWVAGPGDHPVPAWGLVLQVREASADAGLAGLGPAWSGRWHCQARQGGERWQAHAAGPARSLKKQFQSNGVPPWARAQPLVWRDETLLWVPGLGVDARCRAPQGEAAWVLSWVPLA